MSKKFIGILIAVAIAAGGAVFGLTKLAPASQEEQPAVVEVTASPSATPTGAQVVEVPTENLYKSGTWTAKADGKYLVLSGPVESTATEARPIVVKATFTSGDDAKTIEYGVVTVTPGKGTYSFVLPDKDFTDLEVNVEKAL